MKKTYLILSALLAGIAFVLVLLPETKSRKETEPQILLKKINDPARFVSPDQVAARLINRDPSIQLIDVRNENDYADFSLPGALNIPLNLIHQPEWEEMFNTIHKDVVFYSNDDLFADQAWILCTRLGYKNIFVLKGGLNQWFKDIIRPAEPEETAPTEDFDLYSFRKAASLYFTGANITEPNTEQKTTTIELKPKVKKTITAGGC